GDLPATRERGRDGRRSERESSGAQARRDPRPRPRQVSLPLLAGPWWPPPEPHRRLLARDEGYDRGRTMFCRSPSVLPAHTPGAYGTSRATHLRVSLVVYSASYFADAADYRPPEEAEESVAPFRITYGYSKD